MNLKAGLLSSLPSLYARWLTQSFHGAIPEERLATCSDCPMCSKSLVKSHGFDPRIKCCSYVPSLPNFLVGRILLNKSIEGEAGRKTIEERILAGISMSPLGVASSSEENVLYQHIIQNQGFGQVSKIRCPHYLGESNGSCGIYENRNAVCATFFCKHNRGVIGGDFWTQVRSLLGRVESVLARWCVLRMEMGQNALNELLRVGEDGSRNARGSIRYDGTISPEYRKVIWGKWYLHENEFFEECSRLVEPLSWPEVVTICGAEVESLGFLARHAYDKLISEELPSSLRVGNFKVVEVKGDSFSVVGNSPMDPVALPGDLLRSLHRFDGRQTREILEDILQKDNIELEPGFVRKLADYGIVVSADEQKD